MSGFGLNDTVAIAIRILQNHREIVRIWHDVSALLQKIGLLPPGAEPAHATHAYNVEWVQQSINTLTNAGLDVDGTYGRATFEDVKKYQEGKDDLEADGWAGLLTIAEMEKDLASTGRARK